MMCTAKVNAIWDRAQGTGSTEAIMASVEVIRLL